MVAPNPLRNNPLDTAIVVRSDPDLGYEVRLWATLFPEIGVEYHVDRVRIPAGLVIKMEVYCKLFGRVGPFGMRRKENYVSKTEVIVSSSAVRFKGLPKRSDSVCFASCGLEQITNIREGKLLVEAFKLIQ